MTDYNNIDRQLLPAFGERIVVAVVVIEVVVVGFVIGVDLWVRLF